MAQQTKHQIRMVRRKNELLDQRARIDQEIKKIDNPDKRPLPEKTLQSLKKRYKELMKGIAHTITVDGMELNYFAHWDGWLSSYQDLSDSVWIEHWEFIQKGKPKCFKSLLNLVYRGDSVDYIDESIRDSIMAHRTFSSYETKVYRFIEKVQEYEAKYQFFSEEIA